MNPPQGLWTTTDQPEVDMERDVRSSRFMAIAELSQRCWSHLLVEDKPGDVLQIRTLLGGHSVHNGLQLHRDERTWLGYQRADLKVRSAQ